LLEAISNDYLKEKLKVVIPTSASSSSLATGRTTFNKMK